MAAKRVVCITPEIEDLFYESEWRALDRELCPGGGTFGGSGRDDPEGIALGSAGPDGQGGEGDGDAMGQVLDTESLGGIVAGGDQGDSERLGLDPAVESGLAGE